MSREQVSKEEAIENLRKQIAPEQYLASLTTMRETYLGRAAELLGNRDLNAASNRTDPRDVEMVNIQFDEALADLNWRVETINERIDDFEVSKKGITRPFDRQPDDPEDAESMAETTEVDESALVASLTKEQLAEVEKAIAVSNQDDQAPPPESIDEIAARRAEVEEPQD